MFSAPHDVKYSTYPEGQQQQQQQQQQQRKKKDKRRLNSRRGRKRCPVDGGAGGGDGEVGQMGPLWGCAAVVNAIEGTYFVYLFDSISFCRRTARLRPARDVPKEIYRYRPCMHACMHASVCEKKRDDMMMVGVYGAPHSFIAEAATGK